MTQSLKFLGVLVFAVTCLLSSAVYADTVWVSSVTSESYNVTYGQTVFVKVVIVAGDTAVSIRSSDSIYFVISDTLGNRYDTMVTANLYSPTVASLPDTIGAHLYDTLTYSILISPLSSLATGARMLQIDAGCTVNIIDSNGALLTRGDTRATTVDTWLPQTTASVTFVGMSLARDTASGAVAKDTGSLRTVNPDTVVLRVCMRNTGQGTAKVTMDTTKITIYNGAGVNVASSCSIVMASDSPHYISGGDTYDTMCFIIKFPDTTYIPVLGKLTIGIIGAGFVAADSNSNALLTVTRTADTPTFTTYYTLLTTVAETVYACNSRARINVPAAKLNLGTEITIIVEPTSAGITAANLTLSSDVTKEAVATTTYQVELTRAADTPTLVNMILDIAYFDTGMTAGEERSIRIWRLNGNAWELLTDSNTPVTANNYAQVYLGSLSIFRCIISDPVANDLSRVRVFPNPFIPYDGDANTGVAYNGAANSGITFLGLTGTAQVKIYTLDGILVDAEQLSDQGNCQWDARNSRGDECASGMYFYLITDGGGGVAKGKLCIIR